MFTSKLFVGSGSIGLSVLRVFYLVHVESVCFFMVYLLSGFIVYIFLSNGLM